jgi:hypothetical protein
LYANFLLFQKGTVDIYDELIKHYKEEAAAETLKASHESKQAYESSMRTALEGKEHYFFEGQLKELHLKNKQSCENEFKNKAVPDLWSSHITQLEKVFV